MTMLTVKELPRLGTGMHADAHGLYLNVKPTGARSWIFRATINGRRREIGLGGFPVVNLADARDAAIDMQRQLRAGVDPLAERARKQRSATTFEDIARTLHREKAKTWRNGKHQDQWINTLQTYAFPKIGRTPVGQVDVAAITDVIEPIWQDKAETASRLLQRIGATLDYARAKGLYPEFDPVKTVRAGLPKQVAKRKSFASLPYADAPRFLAAVRASNATHSVKRGIEFMVLTASRPGMVRGATWEELDITGKHPVWVVPASRMKADREHRVPLTPRMVEILTEMRGIDPVLAFPGYRKGKPISENTFRKLAIELGFEVTAHGFRASFKDWCREKTEYEDELSEIALAHQVRDATWRAYARSDLIEKRRQMMADWQAHCCGS